MVVFIKLFTGKRKTIHVLINFSALAFNVFIFYLIDFNLHFDTKINH